MRPDPSQARRPSGSRALATALTALFVLAQALGFAHRLEVRHAACPEHGELVHVDGGAPAANAASARARGAGAGHRLYGTEANAPEHHEHCIAIPAQKDRQLLPPAPCAELPPAAMAPAASPPVHAVPSLRLARYLIAPKHSPPL